MAADYFPTTFARQYSQVTTLTTAGTGHGFGFPASRIRVENTGGVPIFVDLSSTGAASTGDLPVAPKSILSEYVSPTSGLGLYTTSTGHQPVVRVAAWGG